MHTIDYISPCCRFSFDILDLLEGHEHLDLDATCHYFGIDATVPEKLRGTFYGISGFNVVTGLDLLFE